MALIDYQSGGSSEKVNRRSYQLFIRLTMVTLNNSISSTQGNYFADLIEGVSTVLQYRAMKHHSFAY